LNKDRPKKPDGSFFYDDDEYTNTICEFVYFTEFIVLPDKDILIGMQPHDDESDDWKFNALEYHKMSDIKFSYYPVDNVVCDEDFI